MNFQKLVISGGAVKGLLALGALQYLKDNNYINELKTYVGTSVGAMICYLLAIGYTPIEIIVNLCTSNLTNDLEYDFLKMVEGIGAMNFLIIQEFLEKLTVDKIGKLITLEELKNEYNKTLICTTYNLSKRQVEYLSYENNPKLPCIVALRMSASLPLAFERFKYQNNYYIDGGVADNLPISIVDTPNNKESIIVINLITLSGIKECTDRKVNALTQFQDVVTILIEDKIKNKIKETSSNCKIITLGNQNNDSNSFNFTIQNKDKLKYFSNGYQEIKNIFNKN